jgi:hypothetical protein
MGISSGVFCRAAFLCFGFDHYIGSLPFFEALRAALKRAQDCVSCRALVTLPNAAAVGATLVVARFCALPYLKASITAAANKATTRVAPTTASH